MKKKQLLHGILALALTLGTSQQAMAWGQRGHDTVCAIAQRHLSKKAQKEIANLLDGQSIVYWANWLDEASNTPAYEYSKTWHFKNINDDQTFDTAPLEPKGNIVDALNQQIDILKSDTASRSTRQLSLKMVIHLMGDLHQPLHMGHFDDLGGNKWKVKYFGKSTNLHTVWDTDIVESGHKWSHTEWAEELDRKDKSTADSLAQGDVRSWARETYELCKVVYATTPTDASLSYDYMHHNTRIIEAQLLKGGLRLARVLNEIFK